MRRSRLRALRSKLLFSLFALSAVMLSFVPPASAAPGVPRIVNVQGRLMDAGGTLLGGAGTEYCFRFSFYDSVSVGSGAKLWPSGSPSTMTVNVRNGIYSAGIGNTNAGGDTLDFNFQDTDTAFLNVDVAEKVGATCAPGDGAETFETLSPRQRIYASGYALNASMLAGFTAAQHASGDQVPVLSSGNLILGGVNPILSATTTNVLTLQGSSSGDIRFFSAANSISAAGNALFAGTMTSAGVSTTNATATNLTVSGGFTFGSASGVLKSVGGVIGASLLDLASDVTGILGVASGGTGTSTAPSYGQVLVGNAAGGYDLVATSSLGISSDGSAVWGSITGTLSDQTDLQSALDARLSLTAWYATTTDALAQGSVNRYYNDSLVNTFLGASTTVPKTFTANTFTNNNVFSGSLLLSGNTTANSIVASSFGSSVLGVGTTATTTLQGNVAGTSTIQGFVNVLGTNSTSTFSGGLAAARLNLTGTNATSTSASGFDIADGCYAIDGVCLSTGVTMVSNSDSTLTVSPNSGAVVVSLNLANANVWTGLQRFNAASSSAASALDYVAVGRTATTTIRGEANATSTFAGGVSATRVQTTATSTLAGVRLTNLTNCSEALETNANGDIICGNDAGVDGVTVTTFTAGGTWTKSNYPNLSFTQVITTGSGGGGGGADCSDTACEVAAGGGGAGGTAIEMIATGSLGTTETVTVGTAGTSGGNTGTNGGAGNTSSFGSHNTASGGGAGDGLVSGAAGIAGNEAAGGTGSGGDINLTGGTGDAGAPGAEGTKGGAGGASYWGGGGGGGWSGANAVGDAGSDGVAYGSGGGGAGVSDNTTGAAGGAGAGGVVVTMNYTSSGADLAEWYETEADVAAGDVVAIGDDSFEYDSKLGLQKSSVLAKATSQSSVVGVVSTAPSETIGYDIFSTAEHPQPIALAGRVPVNVSLENGDIKAGDVLTVSSEPGRAMRSTKAGVTIGRALEDAVCANDEPSATTTAPALDSDTGCTVLVMVNTSYTTGALLNVAFRDLGMESDTVSNELDYSKMILAEMMQQKKNITASTTLSEMLTDRLAAGLEVITPRVVTDTVVASVIEPLERDVRIQLSDGKFVIERLATGTTTLSFDTASSSATTSPALSVDALGNAVFAGAITGADLIVGTTEKPGGITMYDTDTGEPYCAKIVYGNLETFAGTCGELTDFFEETKPEEEQEYVPRTPSEEPVVTTDDDVEIVDVTEVAAEVVPSEPAATEAAPETGSESVPEDVAAPAPAIPDGEPAGEPETAPEVSAEE